MAETANLSQPFRDDPLVHWKIRGLGGILSMLRHMQKGGAVFDDQAERDLIIMHVSLGNVIHANRKEKMDRVPGGGSDFISKHFPHTE